MTQKRGSFLNYFLLQVLTSATINTTFKCNVEPHFNDEVRCLRLGDFCITPVIQDLSLLLLLSRPNVSLEDLLFFLFFFILPHRICPTDFKKEGELKLMKLHRNVTQHDTECSAMKQISKWPPLPWKR